MKQAKRVAVSSNEFGAVLEIINAHRAKALVSVNVEHLLTNWEIGGYLSAKIKHEGWGKSTIDNLVDYIHTHAPRERGYGRSNLYSMVAVYNEFTSPDFIALVARHGNRIVQPLAGQLTSHGIVQSASGSLGWEDPLEEGMATRSSILAWRIPMDRGAWYPGSRLAPPSRGPPQLGAPEAGPEGAGLSVIAQLCATPWAAVRQDPLSLGILQARILEWVATPSFRESSQPRDQTQVSHMAGGFFVCFFFIF